MDRPIVKIRDSLHIFEGNLQECRCRLMAAWTDKCAPEGSPGGDTLNAKIYNFFGQGGRDRNSL